MEQIPISEQNPGNEQHFLNHIISVTTQYMTVKTTTIIYLPVQMLVDFMSWWGVGSFHKSFVMFTL